MGNADHLRAIIDHYEIVTQISRADYRSGLYSIIASDLREIGGRPHSWGWRYVYNVEKGKQKASRFLAPAIKKLYDKIKGGGAISRPRFRLVAQVSEAEYNAVKAAAEREGVTMAEYIRRLICAENM